MNNNNSSYTSITLNDYFWDTAIERVKESPIYDGSHRGKQANEVGFLGEIVAEAWFNKHRLLFQDDRSKTTHDYILNKKITLDVKTKDRTVIPRTNFDNSVPLYNHNHQRPDYYLFISLLRDKQFDDDDIRRFKKAFIVGSIDIETLESTGKTWKAGEIDPSNKTKFWTDCINIPMDKLIPLNKTIKIFTQPN